MDDGVLIYFIVVCRVVFSPNFFVLDEPTNHLDMETIEALGRALQKFQVNVDPLTPSVAIWVQL